MRTSPFGGDRGDRYTGLVTEPAVAVVLEGAPSYLEEVIAVLRQEGMQAEIVKPPATKPNA